MLQVLIYQRTASVLSTCFTITWENCASACKYSVMVCSGVSLPPRRLWHLPAVRLLPSGLLFAVMWPRNRPVSVQAWCDWSPVQLLWQPLWWGDKFRLWRWGTNQNYLFLFLLAHPLWLLSTIKWPLVVIIPIDCVQTVAPVPPSRLKGTFLLSLIIGSGG